MLKPAILNLVVIFSSWIFSTATGLAQDSDASAARTAEALKHLGSWVWDKRSYDKQTVRLWNSLVIPQGESVSKAILYITVDNGYSLFLDGREVGRGSDWRTLTQYDVTRLLKPGRHILAVEAFNDRLAGGLLFGLQIEMANHPPISVVSDESWKIVPLDEKSWKNIKYPRANWPSATVVGKVGELPWSPWPIAVIAEPPLQPVILRFWQSLWFQITLLSTLGVVVLICLWLLTQLAAQSKAQRVLQIERARIARDIHDDLGARLTQLVLSGEVAQSELPQNSPTRVQFELMCEKTRALSHAMDEVVWAVNSRRDTLRDFVSYVCKYAQTFLNDTPIRCRLDVEPEIPAAAFDLRVRRNLFLAVKEALNNAAKHSEASELFLRIYRKNQKLTVIVEDNGKGFDPEQTDLARNGMINMAQRMNEVGGTCRLNTQPAQGCSLEFTVPLKSTRQVWFQKHRAGLPDETGEFTTSASNAN